VLGSRAFVTAALFCLAISLPGFLNAVCDSETEKVLPDPGKLSDAHGHCPVFPANPRSDSIDPAPHLIDIRAESDFQAVHVANSLNIPLERVPHASFIGQRPVILIASDGDYARILNFCARHQDQFPSGLYWEPAGVHAEWAANDLRGIPSARRLAAKITPSEFLRDLDVFNWFILADSDDGHMELDALADSIDSLVRVSSPSELAQRLLASESNEHHRVLLLENRVQADLDIASPKGLGLGEIGQSKVRILNGNVEVLLREWRHSQRLQAQSRDGSANRPCPLENLRRGL